MFLDQKGKSIDRKSKKLLGYNPKYNLEKGIKEYVDFLKDKINN